LAFWAWLTSLKTMFFRSIYLLANGKISYFFLNLDLLPVLHFPLLYMYLFIYLWYCSLNSGPTPGATPPALFVMGIFKIGSLELFAWDGFEP
jgi:hypothetical protein